MSRRFLIGAEAQADIADAVEWLNERSPELPERFRAALESAFASLPDRPEMFPLVHREIRRALVRHFPYSVFFVVGEQALLVVA